MKIFTFIRPHPLLRRVEGDIEDHLRRSPRTRRAARTPRTRYHLGAGYAAASLHEPHASRSTRHGRRARPTSSTLGPMRSCDSPLNSATPSAGCWAGSTAAERRAGDAHGRCGGVARLVTLATHKASAFGSRPDDLVFPSETGGRRDRNNLRSRTRLDSGRHRREVTESMTIGSLAAEEAEEAGS